MLDTDRTLAGGLNKPGDEAAEAIRDQMGPESYRVEMRGDNSFTMSVNMGREEMTVDGTWGQGDDTNRMRTDSVNGEAPEEGTVTTGTFEVEKDTLILVGDGLRIYLRKLP